MMATRWRPRRAVGVILLAMALLGAACGGDDEDTTTTEPVDGTEVTETDGEPTDGDPASPATDTPATDPPEVTAILERASGSGCTPDSADTLPDGRWFGYIGDTGDDAAETSVRFDLACWFEGDAADDAAEVFGEDPPTNGYLVRNENELLRTLLLADPVQVTWLPDSVEPTPIDYADWRLDRLGRGYLPGVWLTIDGGVVTAIEEQFVP